MSQRVDFKKAAPDGYTAFSGVQAYVNKSGLEHALLELVKMRASQINGCAFCLAMHSADAVKAGERHERLHLLPAWRETQLYTPRERAALAWTEALTLVAGKDVPDDVYEEGRRHFSEQELVDLTYAVITINGWNRMCIAFRIPPVAATSAAAAQ